MDFPPLLEPASELTGSSVVNAVLLADIDSADSDALFLLAVSVIAKEARNDEHLIVWSD